MSLCPICGRAYCDHTMEERDQTYAEMMASLTEEELKLCQTEPSDSPRKIDMGKEIRTKQKEARKREIDKSYV